MAVSAIVGAIITAVASAATAAGVTIKNGMGSNSRGGVIANSGPLKLNRLTSAQPEHGQWGQYPPELIGSELTPQDYFTAWKNSGVHVPKTAMDTAEVSKLTKSNDKLLEDWIASTDDSTSVLGKISLIAKGEGVKGIAVYETEPNEIIKPGVAIAFFLQHRPAFGVTYAGCYIAEKAAMQTAINDDDKYLKNLINTIKSKNVGTPRGMKAFSKGESQTVSYGDFTCSFGAADVTDFVVSYDYPNGPNISLN